MKSTISRRGFLYTGAALTALALKPRWATANAVSNKLNFAHIGVGGRGGGHLGWGGGTHNMAAICDTDRGTLAAVAKEFPAATAFTDYRKLFDEMEKSLDAVVVSTPDHNHACATAMAIKRGKHVYTEKPLCHSVEEAYRLAQLARKHKVATQLGNQGHAGMGWRILCGWVWGGYVGPIKEAHVWTNRPAWPQGIKRPATQPVPADLDWDCWLGPSPYRDFHPGLHGFNWRGFWDFGCGALGDMACHTMDGAIWALKLGHPATVECIESNDATEDTFPKSSVTRLDFPERGDMPACSLTWYEGGKKPPVPAALEEERHGDWKKAGSACLFVGEKASIWITGGYGESPRIIPEAKMRKIGKPKEVIPRSIGHQAEFIAACKGGKPALSNFVDYAGLMNEIILMGCVAQHNPGKKLEWDPATRAFKNLPGGDMFLKREYRKGWEEV